MTTLHEMRRELRRRYEFLSSNPNREEKTDNLEEKYGEWTEKVEFDFETGKWNPQLDDVFTPEELIKLKGRRRVARYVEDDFKNARYRLERAKKHAEECNITSMMRTICYFRDYLERALDNLREGEKYGLPKKEAFNLLMNFVDLTSYDLEKEVEVAYKLTKGCNIEPARVMWSLFGKRVLEKMKERGQETMPTARLRR